MKKTIHAENLEPGDRFTYLGAFVVYVVREEPRPDPTFPGRVIFKASRGRVGIRGEGPDATPRYKVTVNIRLRPDCPVTLQ